MIWSFRGWDKLNSSCISQKLSTKVETSSLILDKSRTLELTAVFNSFRFVRWSTNLNSPPLPFYSIIFLISSNLPFVFPKMPFKVGPLKSPPGPDPLMCLTFLYSDICTGKIDSSFFKVSLAGPRMPQCKEGGAPKCSWLLDLSRTKTKRHNIRRTVGQKGKNAKSQW